MERPNLISYRAPLDGFDEMVDATGHVRPPWTALLTQLGHLPADELTRRAERAARQLAAEGAGHLLHDDRAGQARWQLDPVPLVIAGSEWERLARGLRQRVELLDAVLDDLYGDQRLVTTGVIPAEVVLGDAGYALAARTVRPLGRRLTAYAADLVRDATGRWVVLRDHTDAPAGAGNALLHRTVLTRLLPVTHRSLRVASHAAWFAAWRDALAQLSPPDRPNPRIVVLTPGTDHADFVEHSYLATHLGYNLTTAGDLAVRRGRLWLRGLRGLEPIDVVLRRVADAAADPLELGRPAGTTDHAVSVGVAGLMEAAREGTVGLANSLGSALGGHLALHPYLADACQALRGEPLLLPTAETSWCGDIDQRAAVLADLDGFVLHDTDPVDPAPSVFGDRLSDAERDEWTARIIERPHRFVAQRKLQLGTAPVLDDGAVRPGRVVVRAHVVLSTDGATVLPGGSARVVSTDEPVLRQPGGVRKDVWITADGRDRLTLGGDRRPMPQVDLRESMPSRAAEALFWLGRNAERVEGTCRMALATLTRFEQEPELADDGSGDWLSRVVTALRSTSGAAGWSVPERHGDASAGLLEEMAGALGDRPGGAGDSLGHLLASARTVREFLSGSTWPVVNALASERAAMTAALDKNELFVVSDSLDRMVIGLMALAGLTNESVVRGPGWRFLDIGRRLERALGLLGLIESTLGTALELDAAQALFETLLTACESLVAYRRRYRSDLALDAVWDLVVDDDANPRSLAFQLDRLREDLAALPRREEIDHQEDLLARAATRLLDRPHGVELHPKAAADVRAFVIDVRGALLELNEAIVGTWFAHAYDPRRSGS